MYLFILVNVNFTYKNIFLHFKLYKLTSNMHKYELTMKIRIFKKINLKMKVLWSSTYPHVILNLYHYSIASVDK